MKEEEPQKPYVLCTNGAESLVCETTAPSGEKVSVLIKPNSLLFQQQKLKTSEIKKGNHVSDLGSMSPPSPLSSTPGVLNNKNEKKTWKNVMDENVGKIKVYNKDDVIVTGGDNENQIESLEYETYYQSSPPGDTVHAKVEEKMEENDSPRKIGELYTIKKTHFVLRKTPYYSKSVIEATAALSKGTTPSKKDHSHIEGIRFSGLHEEMMRDDIDEVIHDRLLRGESQGLKHAESPLFEPPAYQEKHVSKKYMNEHYKIGELPAKTKVAILCRRGEMCKVVFDQTNNSTLQNGKILYQQDASYQIGWIYHRFTSKISEMDGASEIPKLETVRQTKDGTPVLILPSYQSIGVFYSCFPTRNGTPRQGSVAPLARGRLHLTLPNAADAIDGLDEYSHVWLVFVFHRNRAPRHDRISKIRPPRLNGKKVGVLATRAPHRPNPIGLTCAKIDRIDGSMIYLSGIDLINETPIIDIKPYVPYSDAHFDATTPSWLENDKQYDANRFSIEFSESVLDALPSLVSDCQFYHSTSSLKQAIIDVLQTDPRPVYMKKKQTDKLYGFRLDNLNIRCSFSGSLVKVVDIERWS